MQYQGIFTPPGMGNLHAPIPISGEGTCEFRDDGLAVTGFAPKSMLPGVLLGILGAAAGYLAVATLFPNQDYSYIGGALGMGVTATVTNARAANKNRRLQLVFPWSAVKKCSISKANASEVCVLIKGASPSGMLHFVPAGGAAAFLEDLKRRVPLASCA